VLPIINITTKYDAITFDIKLLLSIMPHIFNKRKIPSRIHVTRKCWNHVFKHPLKRQTRIEKLERALSFPLAIKLLKKETTYQEVSKEKDKGGNSYLSFGIIGYINGNRMKVVVQRPYKNTNAKLVLYSF
jgi:hypothetical protein